MAKAVMGVSAKTPKPTIWALYYAIGFFALPLVAILAVLDVVLYLAFKYLLDTCYGITCFF